MALPCHSRQTVASKPRLPETLNTAGRRVLNVPFFHWNGLNSCEEQQAYLFRILHDANVRCAVTDTLAIQLAEQPAPHVVKMLQKVGLSQEACGKLELADISGETAVGASAEEPEIEVDGIHARQCKDGRQEDGVDRKQEGEKLAEKLSASDRVALRRYAQRGLSKHQLLVKIAEGKAK